MDHAKRLVMQQAKSGSASTLNAPCGCPLSLFDMRDGAQKPIFLSRVSDTCGPAIWCADQHGWVDLTDPQHEALSAGAPLPAEAG